MVMQEQFKTGESSENNSEDDRVEENVSVIEGSVRPKTKNS